MSTVLPQALKLNSQGTIDNNSIRWGLRDQTQKIHSALETITRSSQVDEGSIRSIAEGLAAIRDINKLITETSVKFLPSHETASMDYTTKEIDELARTLKGMITQKAIDITSLGSICKKLDSVASLLESVVDSNLKKIPVYYSPDIAQVMQQRFLDLGDEKGRKALSINDWRAYFSEKGPNLFRVYGYLHNGTLGGYYFNDYGLVTIPSYPYPETKLKEHQLFHYIGLCKFLSIIKEDKKFMEIVFRATPERTISIENAINGFCDMDSVKHYGTQTSNLDTSMIYGIFEANFKAFLDIVLEKRSAFKK